MADTDTTKTCTSCNELKSLGAFSFRRDQNRLRTTCKACRSVRDRRLPNTAPPDTITRKACRICREDKAVADFHLNGRSKDGYSAACKPCAIAVSKQWREVNAARSARQRLGYREANRETLRQSAKAYRRKNPEAAARGISAMRTWAVENPQAAKENQKRRYKKYAQKYPDRVKAAQKKSKQKRKVQIRVVAKAYRAANRQKYAEYAKRFVINNPEKKKAWDTARRVRKKCAAGRFTGGDLTRIRKLQRDRCACCKVALGGKGQVDHIQPLARGGSNWPNNIQLLCPRCNRAKWSKDPIVFMQEMGYLI